MHSRATPPWLACGRRPEHERKTMTETKSCRDITGRRFGLLTALRYDRYEKERSFWFFRCDCGREKSMASARIVSGHGFSCGCAGHAAAIAAVTTHGMTGTRVHRAWRNMISRCEHRGDFWSRYGGRGITVCARWRESFQAFYEDMGAPPDGMSLDRIDNDGNYEPSNCRWATQSIQTINSRRGVMVEWEGAATSLTLLCRKMGVSESMVKKRIGRGWALSDALLLPSKKP